MMLAFGMPMGPMELIDEVGIDVGAKVAHILHDAFGARMEPSPLNEKMVDAGHLGKKNGKGFYQLRCRKAGRKRAGSARVFMSVLGVNPRPAASSDEEIVERCVLPMINEAIALSGRRRRGFRGGSGSRHDHGHGISAVPRRTASVRGHGRRQASGGAPEKVRPQSIRRPFRAGTGVGGTKSAERSLPDRVLLM